MIIKPRSPEDMDTYRDLMEEEAKERKLEAMAEEETTEDVSKIADSALEKIMRGGI